MGALSIFHWIIIAPFLIGIVTTPLYIWIRRKRLKEAGLIKHRVQVFAWRFFNEAKQRATAVTLDSRALIWAYVLPDHKPSAKNIVREELERRGYTTAQIASWSPDPKELTVPPVFLKPVRWGKYARMTQTKPVFFQLYRVLAVLGVIGAIVAGNTIFWRPKIPGEPSSVSLVLSLVIIWLALYAVWAGILYRKRALRILLLRPFGEKRMTQALRRFVPKNVGKMGHVFTLSDRNYKPNIVFTILFNLPIQGFDLLVLLFLSPFIRNSFRIVTVKKERHYRRLQRFLIRQYRPSYWSFLNGAQALNIRSTDDWWKMVIQMLMQSCEIIVVDLSKVKEGTDWELNEIRAKNLASKCVFVVSEDNAAQSGPILDRYFGAGNRSKIFVYRSNGKLIDPSAYRAHLEAVSRPAFAT